MSYSVASIRDSARKHGVSDERIRWVVARPLFEDADRSLLLVIGHDWNAVAGRRACDASSAPVPAAERAFERDWDLSGATFHPENAPPRGRMRRLAVNVRLPEPVLRDLRRRARRQRTTVSAVIRDLIEASIARS